MTGDTEKTDETDEACRYAELMIADSKVPSTVCRCIDRAQHSLIAPQNCPVFSSAETDERPMR